LATEQCWESCFKVEDEPEERFREVYDDFYRMAMEARRLKNMYAVNGTALFLDSTLASFHATATDQEDQAAEIWSFQRNLAAITALLTGVDNSSNPFFVYQFNEEKAYTCEEFQCLNACEVEKILEDDLDDIQTGANSHKDGNVEAACGMAKRYMQSATCDATVANEMAISFLNSDILHHHHLESSESSSSSSSSSSSESWEHGQAPCYAHFDTRYAIGTHAAGWDEIKKFNSDGARGFYVHDNEYTMKAASVLRECIRVACCPTDTAALTWWNTAISGMVCKITDSPYGETDVDYDDHDADDS